MLVHKGGRNEVAEVRSCVMWGLGKSLMAVSKSFPYRYSRSRVILNLASHPFLFCIKLQCRCIRVLGAFSSQKCFRKSQKGIRLNLKHFWGQKRTKKEEGERRRTRISSVTRWGVTRSNSELHQPFREANVCTPGSWVTDAELFQALRLNGPTQVPWHLLFACVKGRHRSSGDLWQ